jgi:hypothetical protein
MQPAIICLLGDHYSLRVPRPTRVMEAIAAERAARASGEVESHATVHLVRCAALADCWPAQTPPAAPPWGAVSGTVLERGALVFDALIQAGAPLEEVLEAAEAAFEWAVSTMPTKRRVAEAARPSVAPA